MTDQQPKAQDPERIWLEPVQIIDRLWSEEDVWNGDGVEYVRADLYEALERKLEDVGDERRKAVEALDCHRRT